MPAFVGRAAELAQLERLFTVADGPAAALIVGDPGTGKTRLLAELKLRAAHVGDQLQVIGYETEQKVPLASASDLLRSLGRVPVHGEDLDTLVFGRGSVDAALEPLRIFEAAHRAWRARGGNLLLSVDDLQWVDELSLALCHYLLRAAEAEGDRLFLVAASRSSMAASRLAVALPQILPAERLMHLQLDALEIADAIQLAQSVKPGLGNDAARELCTIANGSPFWVQVLAESGSGPDLIALLASRWGAISVDAMRTLAVLVLVAKPVTVADLAAIESWTVERAAAGVAELERTGAIVPAAGQVRLAHDLVRLVAESQISPTTRLQVHRAIASWLEERAGDDDVQLLHEALQHRHRAGLPALDLALRTVRSSRSQLLTLEALRDLARIADEAGFVGASAELHLRLAAVTSQTGEQEMALTRWTLVAERHPDAEVRAGALLAASRAAYRLPKRRAEALPLLRHAQETNRADPIFKVNLWAHEANLLGSMEHRMEDARTIAYKALAAARSMAREAGGADALDVDFREAYSNALQAAFDAATIEMDLAARLAIAQEMVEISRGSLPAELTADLNLAEALGSFGRLGEATEVARRVWERARQRIHPSLATMAGQVLIPILIHQGYLADAEEVALECIGLEHRISGRAGRLTFPRVAMRSVHVQYQVIRVSCGDWRVAIEGLRQEAALQPDPHHRIHPRQLIAVWMARLGGPDSSAEVLAQLDAAAAEAQIAGCPRCSRELRLRSAEANLRIGRIEIAEAHLQAWNSDRQADYDYELWHRHCVALASFARGDSRTGVSGLDQVQEERRRAGFHHDALWGRLDLGAGLSEIDPRRAAGEFRAAGSEAEGTGATTEARLAEAGLRKLGVRTWRRGPAARGPEPMERLSRREREIAQLVAAGVSNPDIARSLFLSRKTVERHVSNILAKTGARNRTQLASLVSPEPG